MATVILAEKPDQARKYMDALGIKHKPKAHLAQGSTFLDSTTIVVSARGHLIELAEPEEYGEEYKDRTNLNILPIIPKQFKYHFIEDSKGYYFDIKKAVQRGDVNKIIVATDKDNEGGAIAFNILLFTGVLKNKQILRAYPTATTKASIVKEFKRLEPITDTWKSANAAIARSRADWLIGMNLSRVYTKKISDLGIYGNFAVGRSISTTLRIICDWNAEIKNFTPEPVFQVTGQLNQDKLNIPLSTSLRVVGDGTNNPKEEFIKLLNDKGLIQSNMDGKVTKVTSQVKHTYAPKLFAKGALYKTMSKLYGWSQKKSKSVMQKNYDEGYQTYPRTDSPKITLDTYNELKEKLPEYLALVGINNDKVEEMDEDHLKKYLTTESKADAHYAITPTDKIMTPTADVSDDQRKMYEVVVRQTVALFIKPYTYSSFGLELDVNGEKFTASNTGTLENGWKDVAPSKPKKRKTKEKEVIDYTKYFKEGEILPIKISSKVSQTTPPSPLKSIQLYETGGLMEKAYKLIENKRYANILKNAKGIGTSATRDQALESLEQKGYINIDNKDIVTVTPNGWLINKILENSDISSPILTAKWEEEYAKIKAGESRASDLVNATKSLIMAEIEHSIQDWDEEEIKNYYAKKKGEFDSEFSLGTCPKCKSPVIFVKDTKKREKNKKYDRYQCTNKDCDFVLFKKLIGNKALTETDVKALLAGKTTKLKKNFAKKDGTKFDAKLKLIHDNKDDKYKLGFTK